MDIQIQAIHFDADEKLTAFIKEKVDKLTTFFDHIIDVEVYLKLENGSAQVRDKQAQIKVNIPGNTLVASETTKKFEESIDLAIASLTRQLKKQKEKMRN